MLLLIRLDLVGLCLDFYDMGLLDMKTKGGEGNKGAATRACTLISIANLPPGPFSF